MNDYYIIYGWMSRELGLKGVKKEVFAYIYGFSYNKRGGCWSSVKQMSETIGVSDRVIRLAIKELIEANLIRQVGVSCYNTNIYETSYVHSSFFSPDQTPENSSVPPENISEGGEKSSEGGVKNLQTPPEKISPNNIIYNNTIDNNKISKEKKEDNLYKKCLSLIEEEFVDTEVKEALKQFLSVRIKHGRLSAQSFKAIICELRQLTKNKKEAILIINNATSHEWMKFYPLSNFSSPKKGFTDNVQKSDTDEAKLRERYRDEMSSLLPDERITYEEWRKTN